MQCAVKTISTHYSFERFIELSIISQGYYLSCCYFVHVYHFLVHKEYQSGPGRNTSCSFTSSQVVSVV